MQERDPASLLSLYRRLLAFRRGDADLALGDYRTLLVEGGVFAYRRGAGLTVALNLGEGEQSVALHGEVVNLTTT